jgi:hypothetical protein
MSIVEADLLGWGVLGVEYIGLDVQTVARLDQHAAQLSATEDSNLARVPHRDRSKICNCEL